MLYSDRRYLSISLLSTTAQKVKKLIFPNKIFDKKQLTDHEISN